MDHCCVGYSQLTTHTASLEILGLGAWGDGARAGLQILALGR